MTAARQVRESCAARPRGVAVSPDGSSRLRLEQELGQLQRHRRAGSGRAHHGPGRARPRGADARQVRDAALGRQRKRARRHSARRGLPVRGPKRSRSARSPRRRCSRRTMGRRLEAHDDTQTVVRTQIHEGPSPWPRGQREGLSSETFEPLEAVVLLPVEVVLVGIDFCVHFDFGKRRSFPGHHSHPLV